MRSGARRRLKHEHGRWWLLPLKRTRRRPRFRVLPKYLELFLELLFARIQAGRQPCPPRISPPADLEECEGAKPPLQGRINFSATVLLELCFQRVGRRIQKPLTCGRKTLKLADCPGAQRGGTGGGGIPSRSVPRHGSGEARTENTLSHRIASSVSNAPAEAGATRALPRRYNALVQEGSVERAAPQALTEVA